MSDVAYLQPPFAATARQDEAARLWHDPKCRVLLLDGAVRSGKTGGGARLFLETAVNYPATYLVSRLTFRELEDSTKKAFLRGDGATPPIIPPELVEEYRAGDNLVRLKNGAEIVFRSLDEPAKLLGLSLGGALVDQIEELDGGPEGEHVFDTILGRLSDPRGPRKLLAIANPAGLTHFVYRRLVNERTRDRGAFRVHFTLRDNAQNLPGDYVEHMEATRLTRPHWYRSYILGEWGAFEGAAYEEWDDAIHVVRPFEIPQHWSRFESLDHGANSPSCVLAWAADEDGDVVIFDEYYSPGLVSQHAAEILRRRRPAAPGLAPVGLNWWQRPDDRGGWEQHHTYADASIWGSQGLTNRWGAAASVATEYREHGVENLVRASKDRVARYARVLELVHVEPGRIAPAWANVPKDVGGAPRLYVFSSCRNVIEQMKSAPVETEGIHVGKAVEGKWESAHGHAHVAVAYGAMSRPAPSSEPKTPEPADDRARYVRKLAALDIDGMDEADDLWAEDHPATVAL